MMLDLTTSNQGWTQSIRSSSNTSLCITVLVNTLVVPDRRLKFCIVSRILTRFVLSYGHDAMSFICATVWAHRFRLCWTVVGNACLGGHCVNCLTFIEASKKESTVTFDCDVSICWMLWSRCSRIGCRASQSSQETTSSRELRL